MRRTLPSAGAGLMIVGGAVAAVVLASGSTGKKPASDSGLPPATARVIRTTLVETKTVSGTLGYGDRVPVRAGERGTLTWVAPVSSTVTRGKPLFKIDERPVVVLYGSLPLYRTVGVGVKGGDVRELERNLAGLGYGGFTVDDTFTSATAAEVRTWQAKLGLPQTGAVEPAQAVITPRAVRVAEDAARVGDRVGGGAVIGYTGTARRVTVALEVADRTLAVEGRRVTVKVPGRRAVKGRISRVGTVVTAQSATPGDGTTPDGTKPATSDARIEVTVTIANHEALGSLDAAPVDVELVSAERKDVLAVPVAALLALPRGGFGIQVVDRDTTRIVPVRTGMFAAGQVEVRGDGVAEGMRVGVPK